MRAITDARAGHWTIGALSELTGVNIETVRYYERIKLFAAPPRTTGGRRIYDAGHVRLLAFIRRARELGFSLEQIRGLLKLGGPGKASCRQVQEVASDHLDDVRNKITDLRKLERLLANTIAQCTGADAPKCPVMDILDVRRGREIGRRGGAKSDSERDIS